MSDDVLDDEGEREEYDSGPFCRHWSDPSDCDEKCARCGHLCSAHSFDDCSQCDCPEWVEPE